MKKFFINLIFQNKNENAINKFWDYLDMRNIYRIIVKCYKKSNAKNLLDNETFIAKKY